MNESIKQAYVDKTTAQLSEWSAKIEVLKARFAMSSANARIDIHTQLETWQKHEATMKAKLEEIRAAGTANLEALLASASTAWNELTTFMLSFDLHTDRDPAAMPEPTVTTKTIH